MGWDEKAIAAQQIQVDALKDQVTIEHQAADLKKLNNTGAVLTEGKKGGKDAEDARKLAAEIARAEQEGVNNAMAIIRVANAQMATEVESGWRERIAATSSGRAERLAVIDAAIKDEEANGMESTNAYRAMLAERVSAHRQMVDEDTKLSANAARESVANAQKMGELVLAAERENAALYISERKLSAQDRVAA